MQVGVFYFYNDKFYLIYYGNQRNFSNVLKKDRKARIINFDEINDNDKILFINENLKQNKIIYFDEMNNKFNIDNSKNFYTFYKNFYLNIYKNCLNNFESFFKSLFILYYIKKDLVNKLQSLGYNLTDKNKEDIFIEIISLDNENLLELLKQLISVDKITTVMYNLSNIVMQLDEFIYKNNYNYNDIIQIFDTFDKIEFFTHCYLNNINFLEYIL